LLVGGRESCGDVADVQRLVLAAAAAVRAECRAGDIPARGIEVATARILLGLGYRSDGGGRCRRAVFDLAVRQPRIAVRLSSQWLALRKDKRSDYDSDRSQIQQN
jgi:hypothetical protein